MAEWHLGALDHRLTQRGWRVAAGKANGRYIAETWEISRGETSFVLQFHADPEVVDPAVEDSIAVSVRGHERCDLYLGKQPNDRHPNRSWDEDLWQFTTALDGLWDGAQEDAPFY